MKKPKRKRRSSPFRKFILKSMLWICILTTAMALIALSPVFTVKKINVTGTTHYKEKDIALSSGLSEGLNWFRAVGFNPKDFIFFRCSAAESGIMSGRPYIKNVTVKLSKIGEVSVSINERIPVMAIPYLNANFLVDNEGYIVDSIDNTTNSQFPVIKGIELSKMEVGKSFASKDQTKAATLKKLLETIRFADREGAPQLYDVIDFVDVENANDTQMLLDSRILVKLGSMKDIDDYRIRFLKEVFFGKIHKNEKGTLDFTLGESPHFIPN